MFPARDDRAEEVPVALGYTRRKQTQGITKVDGDPAEIGDFVDDLGDDLEVVNKG